MPNEDYRSGFRSGGGYAPPSTGAPVTNHEMNSVAYVPNIGFVAFHDSLPMSCLSGSSNGKTWGGYGTQRVMGEIPLFVAGGTVYGVDTQALSQERVATSSVATYPEFVNQRLGVTGLTDAVNCWASSGTEILLLELGGRLTVIPLETTPQTPPPAGTPSAPRNVSAIAFNTRARVSWELPTSAGSSSITSYNIEFSTNNGQTWNLATSFGPGTGDPLSRTVTGLTNGLTYIFRVAAVNTAGAGAVSLPTIPVTPNISPPTEPLNLTATPTNWVSSPGSSGGGYNTAYRLAWDAPTGTGGSAITGYKVELMMTSTPFAVGNTFSPTTNTTEGIGPPAALILKMRVGLFYSFRVTAVNAAGPGDPSAVSAPVQLK